jgi:hypothetical protein
MRTSWTRSTTSKALFASCILALALVTSSKAQSDNGGNSPALFMNLNGGFGMLYGGFGGKYEGGIGHVAGFGALGYATERLIDTTRIAPSVNYHFGIRYYFNVGSDAFFPRIGLGYGWVTNYYSEKIGNQPYEQHVKGLSLHLGAQFYSPDGIVFNFDLGMASKYTILNSSSHPYFFPFYIRPNVGIGYDLTRLLGRGERQHNVKNRTIDPFAT